MDICIIQYALIIINILIIIYFASFMMPTFGEYFGNSKKFYYYFSPGCHFCKSFTPIFDQLQQVMSSSGIEFIKVDITNSSNADLVKKEGAYYPDGQFRGVPHLVFIDGSNRKVFGESPNNGMRSYENVKKFLSS
jgi:thiol-disulfide isomerase/thioredoxin